MCRTKGRSRGFTLVASLLVLALLSGIAISLLFMVQGAGQVGGNDLETNQAYYGAESGMELLTANLAALYQQSQSPTPLQITALTNNPPDSTMIASMNYQESITWTPDAFGNPASHTSVIDPPSPNAGLTAEIIPLTLKVVATRPGGASVNMTRGVEVALIPVFQFGVFSDSDLSYFAGPNFNFQGRVHTNGNLFLAEGNGNSLVLNDKVTAVNEIIRDRLANNFLTNANYTGNVYVLKQSHGCDGTVAIAITCPKSQLHTIYRAAGQLERWNSGRRRQATAPRPGTTTSTTFPHHIWRMDRQQHVACQYSHSPCLSCRARTIRPDRFRLSAKLRWANSRPRRRDRHASTTRPTSASCWPAIKPICIPSGQAFCRRTSI